MSGTSSVGQASVYEAGDQRNSKDSESKGAERYHEGKSNSHVANDSSKHLGDCFSICVNFFAHTNVFNLHIEDQRSIANKLAREGKVH